MAIKHFCDRCNTEMRGVGRLHTIEVNDLGVSMKHRWELCHECVATLEVAFTRWLVAVGE
jgi:ribosomal protein L34E